MEYRVTYANHIVLLMDVRLSMLSIGNGLPADYIIDEELAVSSSR